MIRQLPIEIISRRADCRAIDMATVSGLVESIGAVGLINPIRVRATGKGWEVIAGSHRLAACQQLGLVEIDCIIVTEDDLHAELAMIDENLCRAELSPADRAKQTARRKAIYLELHPETAAGAAQAAGMNRAVGNNVSENFAPTFTDETAKITGQSKRLVELNAERGEKVIAEVLDMIRDTPLDKGTYLDKIKRLTPNEQVTAAKRDLAAIRQQERDKAQGGIQRRIISKAPISDEEAREKQVAALMSAWNNASAEAREEFLARIDTPVFDRSAA